MTPERRRLVRDGLRLAGGLAGSTALYYGLRAAGLGVQTALLVNAVVAAVPAVIALARGHRPRGLPALFTALLLAGVLVALVPGSDRFLLAKESLLTAGVGLWFLVSIRSARPLAYQLARPIGEGRLAWPHDWEALWATSEPFRRMWRRSSVAWGVGTLADAVLRVWMAATLPVDAVPALSTGLFVATAVVLNVGTTIHYAACGAFDRRGPFHHRAVPTPPLTTPTGGPGR